MTWMDTAAELRRARVPAVLVTLASVRGHAPREAGAKLIVTADDRDQAIRRMQRALSEYVVQGIRTNIPFHRAALQEEAFIKGDYDTRFVERMHASETGTQRLKKAVEETP